MRQLLIFACVCCLNLLGAIRVLAAPQEDFSDQAVQRAIERGIGFLFSQQRSNGSWPAHNQGSRIYPVGPTALAAYALLEAGVSPQDPRMIRTLAWLTEQKTDKTYSLGLRCNVWLAANKRGGKFGQFLRQDVRLLYKSTADGSYTYFSRGKGKSSGDNSNSQFGLLGVWAGAQGGVEVPKKYWQMVRSHWLKCQRPDGGWTYRGILPTRPTMAAAGVASLYVCSDNLLSGRFLTSGSGGDSAPITRGLDWFARNFSQTVKETGHYFYYLYGVERVGLASGLKYFGTIDWYKLGTVELLRRQSNDGSWFDSYGKVVSTSFALLFLSRGRHPVLFNKLKFPGDWNNRPRDLASLMRWISNRLETTIHWQIINLNVPITEWHDAPILYISASKAPRFTNEDIAKLREFVYQGGMIFSCAEGKGMGFSKAIRRVYAKAFPGYEMVPCGVGHDIYSVYFTLHGKPQLSMITNGIRPLMIHTDDDLSLNWQMQNVATAKWAFQAAANIFVYVTDKKAPLHRGVNLWPARPEIQPIRRVKLARLKHNGNYDPEPLAYERFARLMLQKTQREVKVLGPMDIKDLPGSGARVATMTGTNYFILSDEEMNILKKFIEDGGTLVIDVAGGSRQFAEDTEKLISKMFGSGAMRRLPLNSPLYRLSNMKIEKVRYRRGTATRLGKIDEPLLQAVLVENRAAVIYSREDITAGLVGCPAYNCDGYAPGRGNDGGSAFDIMRNIVLFTTSKSD